MAYYLTKKVQSGFDETIQAITEQLQQVGFGIITRIDIHEKFKEKLGVDFRRYTILGACNPSFAYQALQRENKLGVMLPCNVIVQETNDGTLEVSTINPLVAMQATGNDALLEMAGEVHQRLQQVLDRIQ